ncbi:MAG: endolytic transglycosylase MltG [Gaiellaceae bacterium]
MAEQPRRLSLPAGYRPPQHGPTRRQRRTRRLVVFALLLLFLALLYGAVKLALGGSGGKAQPTTSSAAAPRPFKVIFPEGFTRRQMAGRVAAVDRIAYRERHLRPRLSPSGYLRLTRRSAPPGRFAGDHKARQLEGFLFPATYDFLASTTTRQLVNQQLVAFDKAWARLNLRYARSRNLTSYDVLIIASMIEKEAAAPEERPLIAAVIYNRLHLHMALGIDATIRYGLDIPPTESLHVSQLESDNPYNTRKRLGLPPTPIANPGLASLQAAAHPAHVNYLYYVRKPDGVHHFFTASSAAFERYKSQHGYR